MLTVHINEDMKWTTVIVSYLVNARHDLVVGSSIGGPFISADSPNGKGLLSIAFPLDRLSENYNYEVATFISGLKTEDNNVNLKLVSNEINMTIESLFVQFETDTNKGF